MILIRRESLRNFLTSFLPLGLPLSIIALIQKELQGTYAKKKNNYMKLNLRNYSFRVASKKFLGFLVTQYGMEANLWNI